MDMGFHRYCKIQNAQGTNQSMHKPLSLCKGIGSFKNMGLWVRLLCTIVNLEKAKFSIILRESERLFYCTSINRIRTEYSIGFPCCQRCYWFTSLQLVQANLMIHGTARTLAEGCWFEDMIWVIPHFQFPFYLDVFSYNTWLQLWDFFYSSK